MARQWSSHCGIQQGWQCVLLVAQLSSRKLGCRAACPRGSTTIQEARVLAPNQLVAFARACASASAAPFGVALPKGYYLQRDRDSRIGLIKRGGRQVIRGPIAAYAVDRDIVAGCVGE